MCHRWDKHEGDGKHLTPGQSMASGGLAAILGPLATGPFDVVKTRLMAQSKQGVIHYKGFFDALIKIPRGAPLGGGVYEVVNGGMVEGGGQRA